MANTFFYGPRLSPTDADPQSPLSLSLESVITGKVSINDWTTPIYIETGFAPVVLVMECLDSGTSTNNFTMSWMSSMDPGHWIYQKGAAYGYGDQGPTIYNAGTKYTGQPEGVGICIPVSFLGDVTDVLNKIDEIYFRFHR